MKTRNRVVIAVAAGMCVVLCACGGGGSNGSTAMTPTPTPPSPPPTDAYSVEVVAELARAQSETNEPLAVNSGAVSLYPTDDQTSDPITVN